MGIIKKLTFEPRTLDSSYIKDGLEAVSLLNEKEPYYLVGGIATQSYLPTFCRRPTSDLDFSMVRPLSYQDFKSMIKQVQEFLQDKGYDVLLSKRSRAYNLDMINKKNKRALCLEFSRRNENSFKNNKEKLERELENSKSKILEKRNSSYRVCASEDIAIPKLVRSINSFIRNPSFLKYIYKPGEKFSDNKISQRLSEISSFRKSAMKDPSNLKLHEEMRFVSDLYDVRILSEIAGFNPSYLERASLDWTAMREDSNERKVLVNSLLPFCATKILNQII